MNTLKTKYLLAQALAILPIFVTPVHSIRKGLIGYGDYEKKENGFDKFATPLEQRGYTKFFQRPSTNPFFYKDYRLFVEENYSDSLRSIEFAAEPMDSKAAFIEVSIRNEDVYFSSPLTAKATTQMDQPD